jgi:hypothetical protein
MSTIDQESSAEALSLLRRPPGKRPAFFAQSGVDQLFSVVIELAAEVWVLRERVYAVEDVASKAGIPLRDLVEKWSPSDTQSAELAKLRQDMMQHLFRSVDTGRVPTSDEGEAADPVPPRSAKNI